MQRPKPLALVVDAESEATRALIACLRAHDFEVEWARDGEAAGNMLAAQPVDVLVAAVRAPRIDGMSVLQLGLERHPELCAAMTCAAGDVERGLEAMRAGAYDFQVEPLDLDKLLAVLDRGLAHQRLVARAAGLEEQLDERLALDRLGGRSRAIQRVMDQVRSIAGTRSTVLIEGEPGTGKGLLAHAIHRHSPRRNRGFVELDLGAVGADVAEAELFGHEPLAGNQPPIRGRLEIAGGGTLFLDEIAAASPALQVRLVRLIQERSFLRAGGAESVKVDVRLIVATAHDLAEEVSAGRFREDLYSRLEPVRMRMPALRERVEDIPLFVESFVRDLNREHGRNVTGITPGALERLALHAWPGNLRELRQTLETMVAFVESRRPLDLSDLPEAVRGSAERGEVLALTVGMTVAEAERQLVAATLRHTAGDKRRAAAMLGIGLRTLYRKIDEYGLPGKPETQDQEFPRDGR